MAVLKPSQDVQPLSAFRANAAGFLDQVRSTKRPLVLTQHGKSAAIVLDVDQYEALVDEIEVIRDIRQAKAELARGEGIAAGFLDQVRSTKRPLVLTQHGKSAAIVLDVDQYEALGIPHEEVVAELRARLKR